MTHAIDLRMPRDGSQDAMLRRQEYVDNMTTSTWYTVRETLYADIFQITPLLDMLMNKGKIKERAPKGSYFEIPIAYAKLKQNQKFFGRGAEFSKDEGEFMTRLQYNIRNFGDSITRYWSDEVQNRDEAQILDYIEEVLKNHKASMEESLHEALWASEGPQAVNTLPELISTTPNVGTVGGLDRASNSYVRNVVKDFSGLDINANLLDEMEEMYNTLSNMKGQARRTPDIIITTQSIYQKYVRIARAMGVFEMNVNQNGDRRVNLGMGDAMFKSAEMFYDPNCPEGHMYFLNTDTLEFPYDPMYWMQMTDWKSEALTLERHAQIVSRCNLVCNNFNKNGVIHNIA